MSTQDFSSIDKELETFVKTAFESYIHSHPEQLEDLLAHWHTLESDLTNPEANQALSCLNISDSEQAKFLAHYAGNHHAEEYIRDYFELSDDYPSHAAIFGEEINLAELLEESLDSTHSSGNNQGMQP